MLMGNGRESGQVKGEGLGGAPGILMSVFIGNFSFLICAIYSRIHFHKTRVDGEIFVCVSYQGMFIAGVM